jgi:hypothetical protein
MALFYICQLKLKFLTKTLSRHFSHSTLNLKKWLDNLNLSLLVQGLSILRLYSHDLQNIHTQLNNVISSSSKFSNLQENQNGYNPWSDDDVTYEWHHKISSEYGHTHPKLTTTSKSYEFLSNSYADFTYENMTEVSASVIRGTSSMFKIEVFNALQTRFGPSKYTSLKTTLQNATPNWKRRRHSKSSIQSPHHKNQQAYEGIVTTRSGV